MLKCSVLPAGEHDVRPGRQWHASRESWPEGVHRLVDQDANHRRRQENHAYWNTQPSLCHHVTSPRFPTQHTVWARHFPVIDSYNGPTRLNTHIFVFPSSVQCQVVLPKHGDLQAAHEHVRRGQPEQDALYHPCGPQHLHQPHHDLQQPA